MINKFYKRIHNKYSTLFKFIFFLRYLLGIFFISIVLFLLIPYFLDYKNKDKIIEKYLLENYNLTLIKYESIKYNILPTPNLEIKNIDTILKKASIKINSASLNIYPKLFNIYNFKNFKANKVVLNKSQISLSDTDLKLLINYIFKLKKNKLNFRNLNLKIKKNDSFLIDLKKINFSNYGYNKNKIKGEVFDKKFKISTDNHYNKINFKLLKTGVNVDIDFNEVKKDSFISGILRSKFLNSKLKFNFDYDQKQLKIYKSFFRNKNLSFNNESTIVYRPFFSFSSIFRIEDINMKLLKDININKILSSKSFIKKINIKNEINFKSKIFNNDLIEDLNLKINIIFGRLTYSKKIFIAGNFFSCQGDLNLLDEYPILYFNCSMMSKDKKKLLKEFSIKYKNKNEVFNLNVEGNINILNNKINFKNIKANKDYKASKEDLNYFKRSFEEVLFDKKFLDIFNYKKIKEFIIRIS